jgi:hypothetical protein
MLFIGSVVLASLLVRGLLVVFVWLEFTLWGPGVQFGLFVLSCWFGSCCFLLFDLALQGWDLALMVGPIFFFFWIIIFLGALYDVHPLHP